MFSIAPELSIDLPLCLNCALLDILYLACNAEALLNQGNFVTNVREKRANYSKDTGIVEQTFTDNNTCTGL